MSGGSVASAATLDQIADAVMSITCTVEKSEDPKTPAGGYMGTGAVVHPQGYILTSTTVVPPGASNVRCGFLWSANLPARIVELDEALELAVLKVDLPRSARQAGRSAFPALTLGGSGGLAIGQTVLTIGDAYSAYARSGRFATSLGILSGTYELTRQIAPQPVYTGRVLETTASVAPGMDGGPLLDGAGRLVGLVSLNVSEARWLGVAVPIDVLAEPLARAIARDLGRQSADGEAVVLLATTQPADPDQLLFPAAERINARFRRAAETIADSVVAIEVDRRGERVATTQPGPRRRPLPRRPASRVNDAYREFFRRPGTPVSGLIVSPDGYILTSYFNVWGELNSIRVVLPDGRRLDARRLGYDEANDLAVLKVEATGLTAARFAEQPPALASPVATVGRSPDPGSITMTRGIVSAAGKLNGTTLQIDAETNYGNAGAPVVDARGRCVGLVTHVRPDAMWGQNSGVGFATDAATIRGSLPAMQADRSVDKPKRGFLGVVMAGGQLDITGVVVQQVQDDGPADQAGLAAGDIITHIDGQAIADPADLARIITAAKPGDTVTLTVKRGQETLELEATLAEHPYQ